MGARQPFSAAFNKKERQGNPVGHVRAPHSGDEVHVISEDLKAEAKTKVVSERLGNLRAFLGTALDAAAARRASIRPPTVNDLPQSLRAGPLPDHADFQLDRPPLLKALLPILGHRGPDAASPEERAFHQAQADWEAAKRQEQQALAELQEAFRARQAARSRAADQLAEGDAEILAEALREDLAALPLPFALPRDPVASLDVAARAATIDVTAPSLDVVPRVGRYRFAKRRDAIVREPLSEDQRFEVHRAIVAQLALLVLEASFHAAPSAVIDRIALSVHAEAIDPATGRLSRTDLLRLEVARAAFEALDLARVDPVACVDRLSGRPSSGDKAAIR